MNWFQIRKMLAALTVALSLTCPAAARVEVNGVALQPHEGWIEDGISYVTLRALSREGGYELSWDGAAAHLENGQVSLSARPGAQYIEVNDRALYVSCGVRVVNGQSVLPLRLLEQALGGTVTWDETQGVARLELRGARAARAEYPREDLYWLARIISAEIRGEPLEGQIAVGNVVLNRVGSERYPDTIKEVIFDRNHGVQFEPVENGTVYDEPAANSVLAAKLVLEGANVVGESLYFFAPALSAGSWIVNNCTYYTTIGCHRFYL